MPRFAIDIENDTSFVYKQYSPTQARMSWSGLPSWRTTKGPLYRLYLSADLLAEVKPVWESWAGAVDQMILTRPLLEAELFLARAPLDVVLSKAHRFTAILDGYTDAVGVEVAVIDVPVLGWGFL